jgi:hypothetical protein
MDAWISWTIGYILIGIMLALTIEGMKKLDRLIFIVWPIPIATYILAIICTVIYYSSLEIIKYIKK